MRKLFWQISVTLDGFMEGPNGELDTTAQFADPDFDRYASAMLQSIDDIVLGRRTYDLFAGYWPAAKGPDAARLNHLPKLVFSRTLTSVEWNNTRLAKMGVTEEINRLKQHSGRDIALFGSANLAAAFMQAGLIDEYRILVSPVVLGQGTPAFQQWPVRLKLAEATKWSSGIVALHYRQD